MSQDSKIPPHFSKKAALSWCFYDWANTAFSTVIITFIYSVYFSRSLVGDETQGSVLWSYALAASGFGIALLSPFLGALADKTGARKRWIMIFSSLCIVATGLLWFSENIDGSKNIIFILCVVAIANLGLEMAQVFYNALLPVIAPDTMKGKVSGWGWALGYLGGLVSLVICLFGFVGIGDIKPLFDLPTDHHEHIRIVGPFIALWFLFFMMPLFIFVKEKKGIQHPVLHPFREGLSQLVVTFKSIQKLKNLFVFLISSAIYRDGLNTLFALGGIYAAGQFGMNFSEILVFAIGLNVTAALGAFAFAYVDDWIGSKKTIIFSLVGLIVIGILIVSISDKYMFIILSMGLGIFMGPVQAASRTMVSRISPPDMLTQAYGFYAFTGKSISFVGPLCFGMATSIFATQQAGMISIIIFWSIGLILLLKVTEKTYDDSGMTQ